MGPRTGGKLRQPLLSFAAKKDKGAGEDTMKDRTAIFQTTLLLRVQRGELLLLKRLELNWNDNMAPGFFNSMTSIKIFG